MAHASHHQASVVVVGGGGYGWVNVTRALDDHAQVTLVEPKDAFVARRGRIAGAGRPGLAAPDLPAL
jgi:predicted flavoprotein YhiN